MVNKIYGFIMVLDPIDTCIILLYLLITLLVGILAGRSVNDLTDFSIAKRNFSTPVLVATIAATMTGAGSTLGTSEKTFSVGVLFLLACMGFPISKAIIAWIIAPKMGRFHHMISAGDMMEHFYGTPGRIITGICGVLLSIGYVGGQMSAIGYVCSLFFGVSHMVGTVVSCIIVIIYTSFGGIRAVTITDVVQFAVLIIAIPIVCNVALDDLGGIGVLIDALPETHTTLFTDPILSRQYIGLFIFTCIPFMNPSLIQRMLMARHSRQISHSLWWAALIDCPFYIIAGLIGLIAFTMKPDLDPNLAFPYLVNEVMPIGIKGMAIAGMLAVTMSTADSFLNTGSIMFVHDVFAPLSKKKYSGQVELKLARIVSVIMGIIGILSALLSDSVMEHMLFAAGCWGPLVIVPLFAGIFDVRASRRCFIGGVVAGGAMMVWCQLYAQARWGLNYLLLGSCANACVFFALFWYELYASSRWIKILKEEAQDMCHTLEEKLLPDYSFIALQTIREASESIQTEIGRNVEKAIQILHIDDEMSCVMSLAILLEESPYRCVSKMNGREALQYLHDHAEEVDVVLLDLMMPDMHGFEILMHMKDDAVLKDIPVIIQSGVGDSMEVKRALDMGAYSFVAKPFGKSALFAAIEKAMSSKSE